MSLALVFSSPKFGTIVSDGRLHSFRGGKIRISGDGNQKFVHVRSLGFVALVGIGFEENQLQAIREVYGDFDFVASAIGRIIDTAAASYQGPFYTAALAAGFPRPGAVLVGRDGDTVRSREILPVECSSDGHGFTLNVIGNAETIKAEFEKAALQIERDHLGPAAVQEVLKDLILIASERDPVRVSGTTFTAEVTNDTVDESAWLDGTERKIYFLADRSFSCRRLPPEIQEVFSLVDVVCVRDGFHFGRGLLSVDATVAQGLAAFRASGLHILPAIRDTVAVPLGIVELLRRVAPDFGIERGDSTRTVVEKAYAVRGFAPLEPAHLPHFFENPKMNRISGE